MKLISMLKLLHRCSWLCRFGLRPVPTWARRASETGAALQVTSQAEDDNKARACGWFDSSHDLQHGLQVCEHSAPEALARELPLGAWLELHLPSCRLMPSA